MNNAAPSPLSPSAPSPASPCPCGSNRKYKKCCQSLTGAEKHYRDEEKRELVRRAEGTALEVLINDEMLEAHPEIAKAIQAKMDTYYETWIDQEIPALGGMTPRQAAKDKKMKHVLEALLLEFERRSDTAKQRQVIS